MTFQTQFRRALLDPEATRPAGLTSWNGSDPALRFAIYRNNVTVSLIEALAAGFPVVRAMVGEDFFRDLARQFVRAHPPSSPYLATYGAAFPDFLEASVALRSFAYLPDLARLELLRRAAFHARDADPIDPGVFASLSPEDLPEVRLVVHPSLQVLMSSYAIHSLFAAHQGALDIASVDPDKPEDVLVLRPRFDVLTLLLPPGGASFFTALAAGRSLGDAAIAGGAAPGFSLAACLQIAIAHGAVTALSLNGDEQ